jgi:hypothetical protein
MTEEQLRAEHAEEREHAVEQFMRRHGMKGDPPYDLLELYDLGYDHGGTLEATFCTCE